MRTIESDGVVYLTWIAEREPTAEEAEALASGKVKSCKEYLASIPHGQLSWADRALMGIKR
jgi:hypothetical protein